MAEKPVKASLDSKTHQGWGTWEPDTVLRNLKHGVSPSLSETLKGPESCHLVARATATPWGALAVRRAVLSHFCTQSHPVGCHVMGVSLRGTQGLYLPSLKTTKGTIWILFRIPTLLSCPPHSFTLSPPYLQHPEKPPPVPASRSLWAISPSS